MANEEVEQTDAGSSERIFHAYIREYHVLEKDALYSPFLRTGPFHRKQSSLYMIAKAKKMAFVPGSFRGCADYCFEGDILVGGRVERVVFNSAQLLFHQFGRQTGCPDWRTWAEAAMEPWRMDGMPLCGASQKYALGSRVDVAQSSSDQLYIDCLLYRSLKAGRASPRLIVRPLTLAFMFDWDVLPEIEILYVGKSTDSVFRRVAGHNKWGHITSTLKDDEFAFVYFMDVETSSIHRRVAGPIVVLGEERDEELDRESVALITEAALIKHFFARKHFNQAVVDQDLAKVDRVKKKLVERGYTALRAELILDGVLGRFGTSASGYSAEHIARYELGRVQ